MLNVIIHGHCLIKIYLPIRNKSIKQGSKRNADKAYMLQCRPDHSVPVQVITQANERVMFCAALCMQILVFSDVPIIG